MCGTRGNSSLEARRSFCGLGSGQRERPFAEPLPVTGGHGRSDTKNTNVRGRTSLSLHCVQCVTSAVVFHGISSPSIRSAEEDNEMLEMQQLVLFLFFPLILSVVTFCWKKEDESS
ncbi:hypothetical protein CEXT_501251 [Caerostris extrusa]|uniref:Uncharacterized protein n=1 Tax=Caerostris extrusa TaxID=172846 RepID=A0AAV4RTT6_CAEEX|nr:hypothetical protein CEXT_501251 [Caerostris extrusa]